MPVVKLPKGADLLIEAESIGRDNASPWTPLSDPTASGLGLLVVGGSFVPQTTVPTAASPGHLAVSLDVEAPGPYHLFLRGMATGRLDASSTVSVGLDGRALTGSAGLGGFGHGDQWVETPLRIDIATAGSHTIDIWARQPGFALDSLYVTAAASIDPGEQQARSTVSFLDSIGVNTHVGWLDSRYADLAAVKSALAYLGVHNVRDTLSNASVGARFDQLGDLGITVDWLIPQTSDAAPPGQVLEWSLQQIRDHAWMTRSIEGPNEVDFWPVTRNGLTGFEGANALQRDLYAQVKGDPILSRFPVLQHTLGDYANYAGQQDLSAYADFGNTHAYTGDADPPGVNIGFALRTQETLNGADPVITTETGYGTSSAQSYGRVSELAQAKYIPRLLAEQFSQGIETTYLYQLFDPYANADPVTDFYNYYGLFRTDGSAKPAATALHWLTTWLTDTGRPFLPGTLRYTLTGAPDSLGSMLLQKSNGTFQLLLWNDVKNYNEDTGSDISVAPAKVQLDFLGAPTSLVLRDTLTGTSTSVAPSQHLSLDIPDHVVVLQIGGVPGSTGPTTASPSVVVPLPGPAPLVSTIGLGADSLVLRVSQSYWLGAAQYTVSVDGVQIGGVQTARAFRSDKQSDTLTVRGDWDVGSHAVTLKFLNDAYGGSAAADRNLYLDAASYDGVNLSTIPLGGVGTLKFSIADTTAKTPAPKSVTIGTGTDSLVLKVAQDAWQGDAQYIVSIDGVQLGGIQTVAAYYATGQADTLTLKGDWALGQHAVTVSFTNDAYGGSATTDRNLYLLDARYNGTSVGGSFRGMVGKANFIVTDTAPAPVSTTLGTGSDALVLKLSQDAWQQNAQYTVSVDGVQIGGVQTASAYHAVGQSDTVTVRGNWAVGQHQVAVSFLNDANGGAGKDRNLYLDDASYNGVVVGTAHGSITKASFMATDTPPAPKTIDISTGTDCLVLKLAQDSWQGDAQYTVSIDGVEIGGVQSASAYHSAGQADTLTLRGDWALGAHTVAIAFINDASGGTAGADRNLYLLDASYNGATAGAGCRGQVTTASFAVTDTAPAPVSTTLGAGSDALVLKLSQDAWQQNAQYTVSVDGRQIGGVQTASAYHAVGQSDTVTVRGDWTTGQHEVTVAFVNDAYGGSAARDRNLYLDDVTYDGRHLDTYHGCIGTATFTVTDTGLWG